MSIQGLPKDKTEMADDYNERGISFFNLRKYPEAIQNFTKAIKIVGTDPDYYHNRGLAYYSMKMLDNAIKDYMKAVEILPDNADYHNALGAAQEDSGDLNGAFESFSKAIELEGDVPDYYYNRGNVLWKQGKHDLALEDYSRAVQLNSTDQIFLYKRFLTYLDLERYADALGDIDSIIRLAPGSTMYVAHKAKLLMLMDKNDEAKDLLLDFKKHQDLDETLSKILEELQ
ncbi:MAG: tetratricopeptide repeat protein [Thermoplasmataceae archaeon]